MSTRGLLPGSCSWWVHVNLEVEELGSNRITCWRGDLGQVA